MIDIRIALDVRQFLDDVKKKMSEDEYDVILKRVQEYQLSNTMMAAIEFQYYVDGITDGMKAANMMIDKGLIAAGYKKV